MPDQAQGLRALADRARRDQCDSSLTADVNRSEIGPVVVGTGVLSQDGVSPTQAVPPVDAGFIMAAGECAVVSAAQQRNSLHPDTPLATNKSHARVIAVTSGKGGVGKTNFSSNLSLSFAADGKRVIIVDADLGLANVHVVLGVVPRCSLEHVMRGEHTLQSALCPGPYGVQILGGASGITEMANLDEAGRAVFIEGLKELDSLADVIIIDTGAGLSRNVLAFLCAVEEVIVVTTPEPTAITDAYATIKVVSQENPGARLMLLVNMAQSEAEARKVADRLISIAARFIQTKLEYLGYVPQDPAVTRSVRSQQPFVLAQPTSGAALAVREIAGRLEYQHVPVTPPPGVGALLSRVQRFFGFKSTRETASKG